MSTFSRFAGSVAINQTLGNQSITGVGFTPKLTLFLTEPSTSDIVADVANFHASIGAAKDSSNKFVNTVNSRNGVTNTSTAYAHDTGLVADIANPPGTMTSDYLFDFVSNDADGFTINVTDIPPSNYKMGYLCIGGDALTNISVGRFNSKGSTGSQSVTGLGFKPDLLMFFSVMDFHDPRTSGNEAPLSISFLTASNQLAYQMICRDSLNPSISKRALNTGAAFLGTTSGTSTALAATLTSMDSDGWTLNWGTHSAAVNERIYYVALKGASDMNFNVGNITLPTTIGSFFSSTLSFAARAGIFLGAGLSSLTSTLNNNMEFCMGMVADTNRYMIGGQDKTGVSPSVSSHFSHSQRIFRNMNQSGTVEEDVDISSWQNAGFVLNSVVALGASPTILGYVVMGTTTDSSSGGGGGSEPTGGSGDTNSPDSSFLFGML